MEQFWLMVIAAMGAIIMLFFGINFKRMGAIEAKIDGLDAKFNGHVIHTVEKSAEFIKKDECATCVLAGAISNNIAIVHKAREIAWVKQDSVNEALWRGIDGHSHEGLLQGSRVIRTPK